MGLIIQLPEYGGGGGVDWRQYFTVGCPINCTCDPVSTQGPVVIKATAMNDTLKLILFYLTAARTERSCMTPSSWLINVFLTPFMDMS